MDNRLNEGWGPLSREEIDDAIQLGFTEYTPGDGADFDRFLIDHGYNPETLRAELEAATRDADTNGEWGPLTPQEIDDAIQLGFTEYTPGDQADFDRFLIDHGYNPEKLKADKEAATRDSNGNKGWGPLTPEEIDDAIQLGFTEYTPGDQADFDRFLIDHGYNPEKLKADKDAATRDSNENKGWGPLTPEEIDDAIQLGFTEYTPGDQADFDRFLIDHGYNPEKLKNELEGRDSKGTPTRNNPTETKEKEPVEIGEGTIGQGLSLESELRRIFDNNGISITDEDIKDLIKNNKAEINGEEYQIDYSGADGYDYTDEPAVPFKLVVMKDKEPEKNPDKGAAGASIDPSKPDPDKGAAGAAIDPSKPDPDRGTAGAAIDPSKPGPDKGTAGPTITVKPEDIETLDINPKEVSSEIKYDGDKYTLTKSIDGKVENEATFSRFEEAEIKSNRKRIKAIRDNEDIATFIKASKEKGITITKKQLKLADPTILRGLTSSKAQYGLALTYLRQLAKGKNADKNKLKDNELGNVSISYDVPVDDLKVGYMKKIAKNHKNIGDVKVPSLKDRIKFFFFGNDKLEAPEEPKALGDGRAEVKFEKAEGKGIEPVNLEKSDDISKSATYTASWELGEEEKATVNKETAARAAKIEKYKESENARKDAFIHKGLKLESKDYLAGLEKIDPKAAEEYKNLATDQEKIAFRKEELAKRYYNMKNKDSVGKEKE